MRRRQFLSASAAAAATVAVGSRAADAATPPTVASAGRPGVVRTGFAVLAAGRYRSLAGRKVGIIANPTSITTDLQHEVDVMHGSSDVDLIAVFGPEHGFRGTAQAGGSQGFYTDEKTGLPVYDLYAKTVDEMADAFTKAGVDTVLFDIQDVSARFYTYIWTMYSAMKAAATLGTRFVVLDRPNPLGGARATGPVLHPHWSTGVGLEPIAQQHAMTVGELAGLFAAEFIPAETSGSRVDLTVVAMQGWRRGMDYDATGLPWVMPSPNMPTVDTAFVYPGLGMFEGTNLSEGRGTTRPFELIGAPYADYHWAEALTAARLPGVEWREAYFAPTFSKFVNETCAGVQAFVTDRTAFDAIRTAVAMIVTAKRLYPADFAWRYDTGDALDPYWIDKLSGSDYLRTAIDAGNDTDAVVAGWQGELRAFGAMRQKYLIYGGH